MLESYSTHRPSIGSGDIIAWRHPVTHYSHVAVAWVTGGRILLLEANKQEVAFISVASQRLVGRVDLIRTRVSWSTSVQQFALSAVGRGHRGLALVGVNPRAGNVSSLYAAAILKRAGVHLSENGQTPLSLVDDLVGLGDQIQRLDCEPLESQGLALIQILNSQGHPMTTASIPRDELGTAALSFLDAAGQPVGIPSGVAATTSDATIATAAIVTNADGSDSLVVTPVANGAAVITVADGDISATLDVTVVDPAVTSINIGDVVLSPITPAAPVAG